MSYSSCPPLSSASSTLTMIERPRRRGFSVSGAKQALVLSEGKRRCVVAAAAEGNEAGFEVNRKRDKEREVTEDAMGKGIKLCERESVVIVD
ncbi:unnamed protein product [Brassica rapa subsp. narinosa]